MLELVQLLIILPLLSLYSIKPFAQPPYTTLPAPVPAPISKREHKLTDLSNSVVIIVIIMLIVFFWFT